MIEDYDGADQTTGEITDASMAVDRADTSYPFAGSGKNAKFTWSGGATTNKYGCQYFDSAELELYIQVGKFRISVLPTTSGYDTRIIAFTASSGGGSSLANFGIYNDGGTSKWMVYCHDNESFVRVVSTGDAVQANKDYVIKARFVRHDTDGVAQLWVDGELVAELTTIICTRVMACVNWGFIYSDFNANTISYMDNIVIDTEDVGWGGGLVNGVAPFNISSLNGVATTSIKEFMGLKG